MGLGKIKISFLNLFFYDTCFCSVISFFLFISLINQKTAIDFNFNNTRTLIEICLNVISSLRTIAIIIINNKYDICVH
jgi:hypothetical protein